MGAYFRLSPQFMQLDWLKQEDTTHLKPSTTPEKKCSLEHATLEESHGRRVTRTASDTSQTFTVEQMWIRTGFENFRRLLADIRRVCAVVEGATATQTWNRSSRPWFNKSSITPDSANWYQTCLGG
ncbi:unnamed protein product [Angiostrongylus costaricensis]|uniref:Uncharacterized protein n=1 Tax=Angiostrongylus costaricensis TaxID=334426 RepID=A0A0R3PHL4_ANGCS|nr:unnamed protein product [Angiostrongylus costaricensis]